MAASRKGVERSYGMSTGLIPLFGKVITEKEAVEIIAEVNCAVIGRGGIMGGEGSTVMTVEGLEDQVEQNYRWLPKLSHLIPEARKCSKKLPIE
ncbi:hypothetical protein ES703_97540 [subsurface metagenome]